jgi:ABC-type antimicrobial peptide transport system permease subunit
MEMVQGRFYSKEQTPLASPQSRQLIINQEFARIIGKENPVGMRLSHDSYHATVIGVIKDFNYWPLYYRSGPLIIFYKTYNPSPGHHYYRYIFARIRPDNIPQTIANIKEIYTKFNPEFPFIYRFLDDDYDQLYRSEEQAGAILRNFAVLAVLISCLGLFGLASFLAEQRTKEIGIRKVLGSSVHGIIMLLSKQFLKWVAVANIIALPIAWYMSYAMRLNSYFVEATDERRGLSKRYYKITEKSIEALNDIKRVNEIMWSGYKDLALSISKNIRRVQNHAPQKSGTGC